MADVYDFFLAIDLRDDLSAAELAEVRWHLGLGPEPAEMTIIDSIYTYPVYDEATGAESWRDGPMAVLEHDGPTARIRGAQVSAMARRWDDRGWAITARQEVHVDAMEDLVTFVEWLARHADYPYHGSDGVAREGGCRSFIGFLRKYDADRPSRITLTDFTVDFPEWN
jgi:hypothetical protein